MTTEQDDDSAGAWAHHEDCLRQQQEQIQGLMRRLERMIQDFAQARDYELMEAEDRLNNGHIAH